MPAGRGRLLAVGAVACLLLLVGGGAWVISRPHAGPSPPAPRATATRGFPPTLDLPSVINGTVAGTDTIQVGYFSRTREGATRAAHNYVWALAGSDVKAPLLRRIAAPGRAAPLASALETNKDLLTAQFLLGFRNTEPVMGRYDQRESATTIYLVGTPFKVQLRWMDDTSGGDWKLVSIEKVPDGNPTPEPARS
jgi:hypothetical protein